jgi:hypothetical protein
VVFIVLLFLGIFEDSLSYKLMSWAFGEFFRTDIENDQEVTDDATEILTTRPHHAEGLVNPNLLVGARSYIFWVVFVGFYTKFCNSIYRQLGRDPHVSNLDRTRRLAGCEESLVP